jgi:3-oxoacyl-[acyl-carrier-protein] synthase II
MTTNQTKIVVTGVSVASHMGFSVKSFLQNYDKKTEDNSYKIDDTELVKELENFKKINPRRMDRLTQMTMLAAALCLEDSKLELTEDLVNHVGGVFATEYGPIASARDFIHSGFKMGLSSASPLLFPYTVGNAAPGAITILMGARGLNTTMSGYHPVAYTYDAIKSKKAIAILAGGFEELSYEMEEAYTTRTILKQSIKQSAPIDKPSEGSAMLFLEEKDFAVSRNANILFEICGYGVCFNLQSEEKSIDNFGYISAASITKSMKMALQKSEIQPSQISLIVSLSRRDSEQMESEKSAIDSIWAGDTPPVHYLKHVLGETFGASGCFSLILGYLKAKQMKVNGTDTKYVMVNSFQIGGNCFSMLIAV